MSRKKGYGNHKKGSGRHVQLPEWVQASEAWSSLPPGPRALYVELKRCYNGSNNGEIYLSHRDAAKAINVHKNTIGGYFVALQERGFIHIKDGYCLGPNGVGKANKWALDELPTSDGLLAKKTFVKWRKK